MLTKTRLTEFVKSRTAFYRKELIPAATYALLVGLFLNFAFESPVNSFGFGRWSLNPLWDIFYMRVGGPFLYGNHVFTGLLIISIPIYFVIKSRNYYSVGIWTACAFATV